MDLRDYQPSGAEVFFITAVTVTLITVGAFAFFDFVRDRLDSKKKTGGRNLPYCSSCNAVTIK